VDYLDAVADHIIPELADRPLSVIRVLRGQAPFMQKNVPSYTPSWVRTVSLWAETSKRDVSYALCNDRRTLLWFANQRAVEYHPTLIRADHWDRPTHLVLDLDPPSGDTFGAAVRAALLVRQALADAGLAGVVKTSGAKGVHVFVPIDPQATAEEVAAATRAIAARAERLTPCWQQPRTSGMSAVARCSSIPPGPTGRRWWRPTAHVSGRVCRCRSRWRGTSSIALPRPTSPCAPRYGRLPGRALGPTRCRRRSTSAPT
jgi:DNA ligase D-like protein (predicted polymerase)